MCSPIAVERYLSRVSGPLLDRIDLRIDVPAVPHRDLARGRDGESSDAIRERVEGARVRQRERFAGVKGVFANAHMGPRELKKHCHTDAAGAALLSSAVARLNLSARAYDRILKIARTIADLAAATAIETAHLSEAVQYRSLDRGR